MLYLFFGEDTFRSRQALHEFIKRISGGQKRPLSLSWLNSDTFTEAAFEELARSKNLFSENYIVVCESLLTERAAADFFIKNLAVCADSENIFIFWEENLEPSILKSFKKYAKGTEEFGFFSSRETKVWLKKEMEKRKIELPDASFEELLERCGRNLWFLSQELEKCALISKKDFLPRERLKADEVNLFHITDAVLERNRSRAWFLFQKAILAGIDAEEIFWKIVWQIKNLLLLKKILPMPEKKLMEKTQLHPYVVKKTLRGSCLYTDEELSRYSSELVDLYHKARRGLSDFDTGIEKFLIKL